MLDLNRRAYWKSRVNRAVAERKARVALAVAIGALLGCAALAFGPRAYGRRLEPPLAETEVANWPAASAPVLAPASVQPQSERERIDGLVLTLYPQGFSPGAVTRPRGRIALMVNNRTGLADVTVNLEREIGGRLRSTPLSREKRLWGEAIELPPGRYVLSEASHPDWICHITITPQ